MQQWRALLLLLTWCHRFHYGSCLSTIAVTTDGGPTLTASTTSNTAVQVLPPNSAFPPTATGELSLASLNILAPFYHYLGVPCEEEREACRHHDRQHRVPLAIKQAASCQADVLCLQEAEGGPQWEPLLKQQLAEHDYDRCLWSALHPNRVEKDIVGLCVAWKSHRHRLVGQDCFRRGMVVQLQELETGATFGVANVHLPARPAAVEGRLRSISTTVKKLQQETLSSSKSTTALDGMAFVCGDFNCEPHSITTQLLTRGSVPYGSVRDRNYSAKLTKAAAAQMRHSYRFRDAYDSPAVDRMSVAPVTVSLQGRGPGIMDHIYYTASSAAAAGQPSHRRMTTPSIDKALGLRMTKRQARRKKGQAKGNLRRMRPKLNQQQQSPSSVSSSSLGMKVQAVLATIDSHNETRTQTILEGLPNVEEGFPSDHLPVGALFQPGQEDDKIPSFDKNTRNSKQKRGAISSQTRRRRESFVRSVQIRRRHNLVLRHVAEWLLQELMATQLVRDQPLHQWTWLQQSAEGTLTMQQVANKLRAPDIHCVLGGTHLVVVEVTVGSKPEQLRRQKLLKYHDLKGVLTHAEAVQEAGLQVADPLVIVLDDQGQVAEATHKDLQLLAQLAGREVEEAAAFADRLQQVVAQAVVESKI